MCGVRIVVVGVWVEVVVLVIVVVSVVPIIVVILVIVVVPIIPVVVVVLVAKDGIVLIITAILVVVVGIPTLQSCVSAVVGVTVLVVCGTVYLSVRRRPVRACLVYIVRSATTRRIVDRIVKITAVSRVPAPSITVLSMDCCRQDNEQSH